jgi:hypothetical protein
MGRLSRCTARFCGSVHIGPTGKQPSITIWNCAECASGPATALKEQPESARCCAVYAAEVLNRWSTCKLCALTAVVVCHRSLVFGSALRPVRVR